jgi:putative ABC transport system permease protein
MHPLDLKLIRDLGSMKGQTIAVALVMACGLAVMIMARSLVVSLESARDAYYTGYRFGDVFCDLKRAPNALRARLAEIPGVAAVETRVTGSASRPAGIERTCGRSDPFGPGGPSPAT